MKGPVGISVDYENNIYVTSFISNNVHQLTPDGQHEAAEPNPAEQGRRNQGAEGHLSTEVQQQIRRVWQHRRQTVRTTL